MCRKGRGRGKGLGFRADVCSVSYLDGESGGGQGQEGPHHHHQYIFPSHIGGLRGTPDCWYREPGVGEGLVGLHHQGEGEGDTAAHRRGIRQENRLAPASSFLKLKLNS